METETFTVYLHVYLISTTSVPKKTSEVYRILTLVFCFSFYVIWSCMEVKAQKLEDIEVLVKYDVYMLIGIKAMKVFN